MQSLFNSTDLDKLKEANEIFCTEPKQSYNRDNKEIVDYLKSTNKFYGAVPDNQLSMTAP